MGRCDGNGGRVPPVRVLRWLDRSQQTIKWFNANCRNQVIIRIKE
jgi:hypothetical protein